MTVAKMKEPGGRQQAARVLSAEPPVTTNRSWLRRRSAVRCAFGRSAGRDRGHARHDACLVGLRPVGLHPDAVPDLAPRADVADLAPSPLATGARNALDPVAIWVGAGFNKLVGQDRRNGVQRPMGWSLAGISRIVTRRRHKLGRNRCLRRRLRLRASSTTEAWCCSLAGCALATRRGRRSAFRTPALEAVVGSTAPCFKCPPRWRNALPAAWPEPSTRCRECQWLAPNKTSRAGVNGEIPWQIALVLAALLPATCGAPPQVGRRSH